MEKFIAAIRKFIGKWLPVFAKADDIAEEVAKAVGKLEVYADAKEKVVNKVREEVKVVETTVALQLASLDVKKKELKVEVTKAKLLAGQIRNILED